MGWGLKSRIESYCMTRAGPGDGSRSEAGRSGAAGERGLPSDVAAPEDGTIIPLFLAFLFVRLFACLLNCFEFVEGWARSRLRAGSKLLRLLILGVIMAYVWMN